MQQEKQEFKLKLNPNSRIDLIVKKSKIQLLGKNLLNFLSKIVKMCYFISKFLRSRQIYYGWIFVQNAKF